jgi:hypothetical protein
MIAMAQAAIRSGQIPPVEVRRRSALTHRYPIHPKDAPLG